MLGFACFKSDSITGKNKHPFLSMKYLEYSPFLFDEVTIDAPTEFEIFFRISDYEFKYILIVKNGEVIEECLYRKAIGGKRTATIYERSDGKVRLGNILGKGKYNVEANKKMPYLSFLAINYEIPVINQVIRWFECTILINYANPMSEISLTLINIEQYKDILLEMFKGLDIHIDDYRIQPLGEDKKECEVYIQKKVHEQIYELNMVEESDGTKKLLGLLPMVILSLKEGGLLVIDELDAKLHPKLLKFIIQLYKNRQVNRNRAQIIFTSHDLTTMKNDVFRRDEIWFAAKNDEEVSEIYSLYDLRDKNDEHIRANASFNKQYLEGKYGADPYLTKMLNWEV